MQTYDYALLSKPDEPFATRTGPLPAQGDVIIVDERVLPGRELGEKAAEIPHRVVRVERRLLRSGEGYRVILAEQVEGEKRRRG